LAFIREHFIAKKTHAATSSMAFRNFARVVKAPYGQHIGAQFEVSGTWWGSCSKGDEAKVFKMKLVDFNQTRAGTTGKGKAFKVTSS
jgi:hypothetical protein